MLKKIKAQIKRLPFMVALKRHFWGYFFESTRINVIETFPQFLPYSAGGYSDRSALTIQAINNIFPSISNLILSLNIKDIPVVDINDISSELEAFDSPSKLKELFDVHGSDKGGFRNYYYLYAKVLNNPTCIKNICEIGLGTNNIDIVSNMGMKGRPGASLRAFRDYCPNAEIYGIDIDERILFSEDRIACFYADQTNPNSFFDLQSRIPMELDLFIDDGLHSPFANIVSLEFGLKAIKKGGWVIIEDIGAEALCVWKLIGALLPKRFSSCLYKTHDVLLFAVQRLE